MSATNPLAEWIVKVACSHALRQIAGDDPDISGAADALTEFGPGTHASQLMLCLCITKPGRERLRRIATIVAEAGQLADPKRLKRLADEASDLAGFPKGPRAAA